MVYTRGTAGKLLVDAEYTRIGDLVGDGLKHMFFRHTRLNSGWAPVISARQLEFYKGRVIWISKGTIIPLSRRSTT